MDDAETERDAALDEDAFGETRAGERLRRCGASGQFGLLDISLGGCYVETSAILQPGSHLTMVFSIDDGTLSAEGTIARIHPGSGVAVQFKEMSRDSREKMYRILEFVQNTTTLYNDSYMQKLFDR